MKATQLSWGDIEERVDTLANMIIDDGFRPDIIVGLSRGGSVPARLLCDRLGVKRMISIYDFPDNPKLDGESVLIVDDEVDTGRSVVSYKKRVLGLGARDAKTATIIVFDTTPDNCQPDFYAEKTPWEWVMFPWNVLEDTIDLISKMLKKKGRMKIDEIRGEFAVTFCTLLKHDTIKNAVAEGVRRGIIKEFEFHSTKYYGVGS